MKRTLVLLPLVALAVLVPAPSHAAGAVRESIVYLHPANHILPEEVRANVGDTLKFTVINQDPDSPHNLIVCGDPAGSIGSCQNRLAFTPMLQPNETQEITFTVDTPGTLEYWCDVPGHRQGGMSGLLVVQGEAKKESGGGALVGTLVALIAMAAVMRRK